MQAKEPRTGVFIDLSNVLIWVMRSHKPGARLHEGRLATFLRREGQIVFGGAYGPTGLNGYAHNGLLAALKFELQFDEIVTRQPKPQGDGPMKCDMDAEIAFRIAQVVTSHRLRKVILVSGDGDYVPVVERLRHANIEVVVLGPDECTARDLWQSASRYYRLDQDLRLIDDAAPREPGVDRAHPTASRSTQSSNGVLVPAR